MGDIRGTINTSVLGEENTADYEVVHHFMEVFCPASLEETAAITAFNKLMTRFCDTIRDVNALKEDQ